MCGLQETQPIHLGLPGRLREKPDIPLPFLPSLFLFVPPLPFLSSPLPLPNLSLEVGPLNPARGFVGAAEIEFGAF